MESWTDRHSHSFWVCPIICVTQTEYLATAESFKVDRYFFFSSKRVTLLQTASVLGGKKRERNKQIVQVCIIIDDMLTNFKAECGTQWWLCVREMWPRAAVPAPRLGTGMCELVSYWWRYWSLTWMLLLWQRVKVQPDQAAPGIKRVLIKSDSVRKSTCELTLRNNRICVQFLIGKQFPVFIQARNPTDLSPFY